MHLPLNNVDKHLMSSKPLRNKKNDQFIGTISIILVTGPVDEEKSGAGEHQLWWGSEDWRSHSSYGFINISGRQRIINRTPGCITFFRKLVWNSTLNVYNTLCLYPLFLWNLFSLTLDPVPKCWGFPQAHHHDGTTPLAVTKLGGPPLESLTFYVSYWLFDRDHFNRYIIPT